MLSYLSPAYETTSISWRQQQNNQPKTPNMTSLRFALAGLIIAIATLSAPMAQANCGGCGTKKECPSPTPAPSPAK